MRMESLRQALGWCAVINGGVLLWWWLWFAFAHDLVYRLHGRWFKIDVARFDAVHYAAMAFYKLTVLVFNVVPYLALRIVGA
jgi:hypothetical protein